ncbi:MAG: hypothetical protein R3B57_08945 [Phycisphaerales bacterium]
MDYLKYYSLEDYLFNVVHPRFQTDGALSAFDFFSIVVWKANRAKSKVARLLMTHDPDRRDSLDQICNDLTRQLNAMASDEERLKFLMQHRGFRLPMASAILTVLWPDSFSVYDVRVCDQLGDHHRLANLVSWRSIWTGYQAFLSDVHAAEPRGLCLRDKDRFLWGRSAAYQLRTDIQRCFAPKDDEVLFDGSTKGQ